MRTSLVISCALHVAVLLWALADFPSAREFKVAESTPLPVDIVTPEEFTKIKAGKRDGESEDAKTSEDPAPKPSEAKKEAPEATPPRVAAAPPSPPVAEAEPAPGPVKAPQSQPDKAAEPKPEPEPEPKPESKAAEAPPPAPPARKPPAPKTALKPVSPPKAAERAPEEPKAEPRETFNPDRIAALLNKTPDAGPQSDAAAPAETPAPPSAEPAEGDSRGQDLAMSVNEIDALRAKISQCWIPPVGAAGAEGIQVRLRMQLNRDGTLTQPPEVLNGGSSSFHTAAAESAVRAVWQCQPYDLPAAKYATWGDMILNFDPREMFGG